MEVTVCAPDVFDLKFFDLVADALFVSALVLQNGDCAVRMLLISFNSDQLIHSDVKFVKFSQFTLDSNGHQTKPVVEFSIIHDNQLINFLIKL